MNFNKKRDKNQYQRFFAIMGIFFMIAVLVWLGMVNVRIFQKKRELNVQVENLQKRVQDLKSQNESLKEGTARSLDDAYIEKIAREELDLQKPDEKVFSFVQTPSPQPAIVSSPSFVQSWLLWLEGFFKK